MVVAVEHYLKNIKNHLRERGYRVCDLETCREPVDAAVYREMSILDIPLAPEHFARFENGPQSVGILLVCAENRTPEEVEQILQQKVYGHLF